MKFLSRLIPSLFATGGATDDACAYVLVTLHVPKEKQPPKGRDALYKSMAFAATGT